MRIPEPKSWEEFEQIARDALAIRWGNPDLSMHGRPGQAQDGVDIYGDNHLGFVGVQCKNTYDGVKEKTINSEISKAEGFPEKLECLYIATTAPRDVGMQKAVRGLSRSRESLNKFSVNIVFWEDLTQDLVSVPRVFLKHYPQFSLNYEKQHLRVDLFEDIYQRVCHILHEARHTLAFYSAPTSAGELRGQVSALHKEIGELSLLVEKSEISLPDSIAGSLFDFIQSVSSPVTRYKCFLGVYDDDELFSINDVRDGAWDEIESKSYELRDCIRDEIKLLLIQN